jgi:hypothetical protein
MRMAALLAVLMLACSHAPVWDSPAPSGLQLIPVSTSLVDGVPTAVLTLVNGTREPFQYVAYSPSRPIPYGATEIRRDLGWKLVSFAYCGTGLEEVSLPAGASVTVTLPLYLGREDHQAERVRIVIRDARGRFAVRSGEFGVPESSRQDWSLRNR